MIVSVESYVFVGCSARGCQANLTFGDNVDAPGAFKYAEEHGWRLCHPTFYLDGEAKPRGTLRGFAELCPAHAAQLPPGATLGLRR